jgi:hypothetical protein
VESCFALLLTPLKPGPCMALVYYSTVCNCSTRRKNRPCPRRRAAAHAPMPQRGRSLGRGGYGQEAVDRRRARLRRAMLTHAASFEGRRQSAWKGRRRGNRLVLRRAVTALSSMQGFPGVRKGRKEGVLQTNQGRGDEKKARAHGGRRAGRPTGRSGRGRSSGAREGIPRAIHKGGASSLGCPTQGLTKA